MSSCLLAFLNKSNRNICHAFDYLTLHLPFQFSHFSACPRSWKDDILAAHQRTRHVVAECKLSHPAKNDYGFGSLSPSREDEYMSLLPFLENPPSISADFLVPGDRVVLNLGDALLFCRDKADSPSIHDLICILQMCRRSKRLEHARCIHGHICRWGLEAHKIIGNQIVQMFVDCGSIADAESAFSILSDQNIYTWTSLMLGYIPFGLVDCAINLYAKMEEIQMCPNRYTFVALVKACTGFRELDSGRAAYTEIVRRGYEEDPFIGSSLIDMFGKCDSLLEAEDVFNRLPIQTVVSWSARIAAYVEHQHALEAISTFKQMQYKNIVPDAITYIPILKACGSLKDTKEAQEMHIVITKKGFKMKGYLGNCLVDMYAKCGLLFEAHAVFNTLPLHDVVSWTALLTGYTEHASNEELLLCFEKMQMEGISPDASTFAAILKVCENVGAIDKGREIHKLAKEKKLDSDLFVCSTLVHMYAKCGSLSEAQETFNLLPERDVVSWNVLIAGYAEHGPCEEAINCFETMRGDGVWQGALTYVWVFKACGNMGSVGKGQEMHTDCTLRGFDKDFSVSSILIDMYGRFCLILEAKHVFEKMELQDVTSWNAMIKAYGINQKSSLAICLFQKMQRLKLKPDAATFTCLFKVCSRASLVQIGLELFKIMVEENPPTIDHINCILDLLARAGQMEEAVRLLDAMPGSPSAEMWRILLTGCKIHAVSDVGIQCFDQLFKLNPGV